MKLRQKLINIFVLMSMTLMSGCQNNSSKTDVISDATVEQTELTELTAAEMSDTVGTTAALATVTETTAEHTANTTVSLATATEASAPVTEYGDYKYDPPQEVLNTHFYSDDIETKIMLQNASNEDFDILDIFKDPEVEKELHKAFAENLPQEIVDDMTQNMQIPDWLSDYNLKITSMGYMKYDFNSDGRDDYYVVADLDDKNEVENLMHMRTFYSFRRVYITNESSFIPIKIPSFDDTRNGVHSILSTETNGLKDLLAFCNSNSPSLKYDGVSAYGDFAELDERHTFIDFEILPDNILHLNMNISVIDVSVGKYYTAIKFADNPYLKNNMLYSCYPDGTPRTYIRKEMGDWQPGDFSPSNDGYDFYAELTDEGVQAFSGDENIWRLLDLLEIKYVTADN